MITIRKAEERGHTDIDWLDSRHSFSFGEYYDPQHMGFRALRLINDDRVRQGAVFLCIHIVTWRSSLSYSKARSNTKTVSGPVL